MRSSETRTEHEAGGVLGRGRAGRKICDDQSFGASHEFEQVGRR